MALDILAALSTSRRSREASRRLTTEEPGERRSSTLAVVVVALEPMKNKTVVLKCCNRVNVGNQQKICPLTVLRCRGGPRECIHAHLGQGEGEAIGGREVGGVTPAVVQRLQVAELAGGVQVEDLETNGRLMNLTME